MKLLIAGSIAALTLAAAAPLAPVSAQSVYIGPGGVGVGVGPRAYDRGYRERGPAYRRGDSYEGRSVYRDRGRGYGDRY